MKVIENSIRTLEYVRNMLMGILLTMVRISILVTKNIAFPQNHSIEARTY